MTDASSFAVNLYSAPSLMCYL